MRKGDQQLSEVYIKKILQFIQSDVNFKDDRVPLATCRFQLGRLDERNTNSVSKLYVFETISFEPSVSHQTVTV